METDSPPILLASSLANNGFVAACIVTGLLLLLSALISGSEVAYFSLRPGEIEELEKEDSKVSNRVITLLSKPKRLLATILIANNFVNVGIVILSTYILEAVFSTMALSLTVQLVIQVGLTTFIILLIGEVIPKVYATRNGNNFARFMASPLLVTRKIFFPVSSILVKSTNFIDKRVKRQSPSLNVGHLEHTMDLISDADIDDDESKLLQGIVKFGNIDVKQIMMPRTDVVAMDSESSFEEVIAAIIDSGYSRIPVYEESFDNVLGVLYTKDLLPHLETPGSFDWKSLIRQPFFVPENKKIDDLLREFQDSKVHMAIVVDEYGGTSGIVTLEDIIEEIVGEISDEFDDDDIIYSKLDESNYVFEGKTPLISLYRILDIDGAVFEENKGDSDTVAGFLIEISGKILKKNERVDFDRYTFTIEAADKRRVKQVKVTIKDDDIETPTD